MIRAGADFIQTNYVYDMDAFRHFMTRVRDLGIHEEAFLLVGVGPIGTPKTARWMRANVPGIHIPDALIERLEKAEKPAVEGKKICIDLIHEIRDMEGIAGIHVMAYRRDHLVGEIIEDTGILKDRAEAQAGEQLAVGDDD